MLIKIIICLLIPLLFCSIILDKSARRVMLYLCLGTVICFFAAIINTWAMECFSCSYIYLTTTIAPLVEEILKFIPIFVGACIIGKKNADKSGRALLIVMLPAAFALGIGFAITESLNMLVGYSMNVDVIWVFLRGVSSGLMHPMTASMIAMGVLKAKEYPELSFVGIVASLFLAMIYHGFYNCLVNSDGILKYVGVIIPILTYVAIFVIYRKDAIKAFLKD